MKAPGINWNKLAVLAYLTIHTLMSLIVSFLLPIEIWWKLTFLFCMITPLIVSSLFSYSEITKVINEDSELLSTANNAVNFSIEVMRILEVHNSDEALQEIYRLQGKFPTPEEEEAAWQLTRRTPGAESAHLN
jgi:ABC-type multidrug transport system fused ATPase/permease subunit